MKNDIYVDNVITGADSEATALQLYMCSKSIFKDASLNLREWLSNSDRVNESIPIHDRASPETINVLGYLWNHKSDKLSIKELVGKVAAMNITKRNVLKVIASVFDPMGLYTPVLLRGKLLLQTIWSRNYDWDENIDDSDILSVWSSLSADLVKLSSLKVHRCISHGVDTNSVIYDLFCFCDASSKAYATCVYLRQICNGVAKVDLIFAKSRLAPLKGMTMPRLELLAVLIGVRSLQFVKEQLKLKITKTLLWTDSKCVIGWLNTDRKLEIFVRNRILEIKSCSVSVDYVKSGENPADIASRGTNVQSLQENQLWWHSPDFTSVTRENEMDTEAQMNNDWHQVEKEVKMLITERNYDVNERPDKHGEVTPAPPFSLNPNEFSSISKLFRVTAYALRFIQCLKKTRSKNGPLKSQELQEAQTVWLKYVQQKYFSVEIETIRKGKATNLQKQLGLFVDNVGLLRCRGRLGNSCLSAGARCPILLRGGDKLTHLLISKIHKQNCHGGVSQTLAQIRMNFWIPQGRAKVKTILRS